MGERSFAMRNGHGPIDREMEKNEEEEEECRSKK